MEKKTSVTTYDKVIVGTGLVGGALILLASVFITFEVFMRYIFNSPTIWTMEICIYIVLASTFLSLAYTLKMKNHVKVDSVTNLLSSKTAATLEIFTSLLSILYCAVMAWEGIKLALLTFQKGEVSPTILNVPLFIPQAFIPIGSILLILQFVKLIQELYQDLRAPAVPEGEGRPANSPSHPGSVTSQILVTALFAALLLLSFFLLKVSMNLGLLVLFFVVLFIGLPVAVALGLFGVFGFYFLFGGAPMLVQVPIVAYSTMDSFVMVALPLFILTSNVLRNGGIGIRIYKFANVLVRHLPGGLGIASVIFCGLFAAMTGSSAAVAAAVSLIALPEMLSRGYSRELTIGLLAAGGTLGILFPPSVPLILYASMTNESIGSLFMAGVIPGIILSGMFCGYVAVVARKDKNLQRQPRASFKEIINATKEAAGGLGTILIIIGGIYSGIFTPTESGGIAAFYCTVLCLFVYQSLSLDGLKQSILETARISSFIMLIIIGANITGQVILMAQISQQILTFIKSAGLPPWLIILSINIFLVIMGMPLEAISILVITLPILYPVVTGLGFSGVWFGIIIVVNMEMALISPPEGVNLFILQNLAQSNASEVTRGVIPFVIIMGIFLALISCFPILATWLPSLVGV